MKQVLTYIPNELASAVKGGFVTSSKEIRDNILNVSQQEINRLVIKTGEDILRLSQIILGHSFDDIYTKEQVDSKFQQKDNYATEDFVNQKNNEQSQQLQEHIQYIQQYLNQLQRIQEQINLLQEVPEQINQLKNKQQKHIILNQSEYDNLESYEKDTIYIILEDIPNWGFGDNFPIILSGEWTFGSNLPIILA